jgi:hypothetical protein
MNKEKATFLITITIAMIILVVATGVSVVLSEKKDNIEIKKDRSVYNKKASGYAAWLEVAEKSGININTWSKSFNALSTSEKENFSMVLASPEFIAGSRTVYTSADITKLLNWVRNGNTLIVLDDFNKASSRQLLNHLNLELAPINTEKQESNPGYHDKFFDDKTIYQQEKSTFDISNLQNLNYKANKISTTSTVRLKNKYIKPLVQDDNGIAIGKRDYGSGVIYILTIPDFIENNSLYEPEDNYQFFTNLTTLNNKEIMINEFVHGYIKTESAFTYYKDTLLSPISKQFALILIILLWSVSRRFGKVRPIQEDDRRSTLEYVEAMANLYKQAGLTGTTLAPVYQQFKLNICKELRTDPHIPDDELFSIIRQNFSTNKADDIIQLLNTLQHTIKNDYISKEDMLDLCRKMNVYRLKG